MKKVFYIGYYSDYKNNRLDAPSATTKMDYIISSFKNNNYEVEVLSLCGVKERNSFLKKYKGYIKQVDDVKFKYFVSYTSKHKIIRFIGKILTWKSFIKYYPICQMDYKL